MDIVWNGSRTHPNGAYLFIDEWPETPTPNRHIPAQDARRLGRCSRRGCQRHVGYPGATVCAFHAYHEKHHG